MDSLYDSNSQHSARPFISTNFFLFIIVLGGTVLRLKDLTFQSLWLDEIHTVNETNPAIGLSDIVHFLRNTDQHPPLYFFGAHYWFKLMGYNDFMARLFSVLAGVTSILAMYLLAKELRNKTVGLIAAALVAFNYFTIFYSQEARNYIFAFLFCNLSFYYMVKVLKEPTIKKGIGYGLATGLFLYTHYYSLFAVAAQVVIVLIFFGMHKQYKSYFQSFGAAAAITLILYFPWLSTLLKIGSLSSFWIEKPAADFFIAYFKEYFGHYSLIVYINFLLIVFFLGASVYYSRKKNYTKDIPLSQNLPLIALLLLVWVVVSYAVPYVRSVMGTPMLFPRYTIITLPAIILAIALGIDLLRFTYLKVAVVVTICVLTTVNLIYKQNYYQTKIKQEWREMTLFIAKNNAPHYPVVSDREWYLDYYFKQFNADLQKAQLTAEFLQSPSTQGFWVMTGHGGNPISVEMENVIDKNYMEEVGFNGVDTWAKLYLRASNKTEIKNTTITGGDPFGDGYQALWTNSKITSQEMELPAGKYVLVLNGYGTKADEIFPLIEVFKNGEKIGVKTLSSSKNYNLPFTQKETSTVTFTLNFMNDSMNEAQGEDRNVFIKSLKIRKLD